MSEEEQTQDLSQLAKGEEAETEQEEPQQEEQEEQTPQVSQEDIERRKEEKARQSGWKPLEEWVNEGGDPEQWRPAGEFLLYGEMVDKLKSYEQGFEQRAKRLEKYYTAQMEAQRKSWENKLEEAAESGDKEAVKEANQALRDLDKEAQQSEQQQGANPEQEKLERWNAQNPWINENTPKANHAKAVFAQAVNNGTPVDQALSLVESEVARHYPEESSSQSRKSPPTGEKGAGNKGFRKSKGGKLTWDDLTSEEAMAYKMSKNAWSSTDDFLKAVQDDRKAKEQR